MNPRYNANLEILSRITLVIHNHPDWRFHQILQNLNITDCSGTDKFYEESEETLKNMITCKNL